MRSISNLILKPDKTVLLSTFIFLYLALIIFF